VLNLIGNALKFTNEGGVTISADVVRKKSLSKPRIPGIVKVRVADTGIGVSLDKQELFQSFSQVDDGSHPSIRRVLGLTISEACRGNGGTVNFYSMGEGSNGDIHCATVSRTRNGLAPTGDSFGLDVLAINPPYLNF